MFETLNAFGLTSQGQLEKNWLSQIDMLKTCFYVHGHPLVFVLYLSDFNCQDSMSDFIHSFATTFL